MFIKEYIKHPRKVGAIAPSSKYLAYKMIKEINFELAKCIVEYGPGTGAFTEKILARAKDDTKIILLEVNEEFYCKLKELYGHKKNVIILNESAEKISEIIKKYNIEFVDYIISGLPFASLPEQVSMNILKETSKTIEKRGEFITFQYTLFKKNLFKEFFNEIEIDKTFRNLPPAYVLQCKMESESL